MAKARDRVDVVEHHTIIVASAGWITAMPAPNTAADAKIAATPVESAMPSEPTEARTVPATATGSGPRRSTTRPVKGSTTSAATANSASTVPAVLAPRPRTCAT